MRSVFSQPAHPQPAPPWSEVAERGSYRRHPSRRDRAGALLLSLALVGLLILLLLRLGVLPSLPRAPSRPTTFSLSPSPEPAAAPRPAPKRAARAAAKPVKPPPPAARPVPPVPRPATPAPILTLSRDEFAATDIGRIAGEKGAAEGKDAGDSVAAYGPGEGPGGQRLYQAEWYREPPPGVLALYLPGGAQAGYATVACQTIAAYHVENCRELDETPRGSGLARAVRQAAWQFLVRPPRLGGKPLVGAWVRIRFTLTERGAEHAP